MKKLDAWLQAIRPNTLIASISPVLLASCLAAKQEIFSWSLFFYTFFFALLIQIGTNISNDYFDFIKGADTIERTGPARVCQAKLLPLKEVRRGFCVTFFAAFLLAFAISIKINIWLLLLGIVSIVFGLMYTAGPFPIAYLGLGDLFVFLFFGPIACSVSYFIQTNFFSLKSVLLGSGCGLLSCAILVINNLRDQVQDSLVQKKTLVVRFGKLFGQIEYGICMILPCLLPIFLFPSFTIIGLCLFTVAVSLAYKAFQEPLLYHPLLIKTCYFLWAYTLFVSFWIFSC